MLFRSFESLDEPGKFTLAIRGSTDMNDFYDDIALIVNDGIAVSQLVDLYNFWQRATTPAGETYTAAVLASDLTTVPTEPIYFVDFVDDSSLLDNETLQLGTGTLNSTITSIDVTGHSLGGHLAMAFTRLFPSLNTNATKEKGTDLFFSTMRK